MSVKSFSIKNFAENFYEQKETRFTTGQSLFNSVTAQDAFDMSLACVKLRHGKHGHRYVRFYVDGKLIQNEKMLDRWFPNSADRNFLDYKERLTEKLKGREYYFVVGDLHASDRSFYHRLVDFSQELAQFVGRSKRRVDTQLFVGNASRTPFGIHNDAAGVFHIPLIGKKKMRFWSEEYVQGDPTAKFQLDYASHVKASTSLEAKPGEMLYWPSRLWHIAESDGEFGVTWGLGWWNGDHRKQLFENEVRRLIARTIGTRAVTEKDIARYARQTECNEFQTAMQRLGSAEFKALGHQIDVEYLKILSNFGFWTVPDPRKIRLKKNSRFSFASRFKTIFYDLDPSTTAVICNGESRNIKTSSALQPLIRKFRKVGESARYDESFEIQNLMNQLKFDDDNGECLKLLNFLATREGLEIEGT